MIDAGAMGVPGWRGGDGNAAYLDKTLRHERVELSLDDSVSAAAVRGLIVRASVVGLLFWMVAFIPVVLAAIAAGRLGGAAIGWWFFAGFGVFLFALLGCRVTEPLAEWRVLLENRVDEAEPTYVAIAAALRNRRIPLAVMPRRMYVGDDSVRNRLALSDGDYTAYVSVFNYGTSLYLGWMMWRSRRGYALIGQFVVDMVNGIRGRLTPEEMVMRTERPRAMREAVHAACREGLTAAVEFRRLPIEQGFPGGVLPPIDEPAAPAPRAGHRAGPRPDHQLGSPQLGSQGAGPSGPPWPPPPAGGPPAPAGPPTGPF